MSLKTTKMGNSIVESWSHSIASVELLWIYSGESETGIWTTNSKSFPHLFFFHPKKDTEANKNHTGLKVMWSGSCTQLMLQTVFSPRTGSFHLGNSLKLYVYSHERWASSQVGECNGFSCSKGRQTFDCKGRKIFLEWELLLFLNLIINVSDISLSGQCGQWRLSHEHPMRAVHIWPCLSPVQ